MRVTEPGDRSAIALLWVLAVGITSACAGPGPVPALIVEDEGGVRARVSACLGYSLSAAVAFSGPEVTAGMTEQVVACVAGSGDCAGVRLCLGLAGPSCSGDGRCEDGVAVHCPTLPNGWRSEIREDCAADPVGNTGCAVIDDNGKGVFAVCQAGSCRGNRCEGNTLISCRGSVEVRNDCASRGRVCVVDAGQAFCALPEACARDHCQGTTALLCRGGHAELRQDCAALVPGGRCRDRSGAVDCVAATWDPTCPTDEPYLSRCAGAAGEVCHAGARLEVDCAAFQGGRCEMDAAVSEARCQLPPI